MLIHESDNILQSCPTTDLLRRGSVIPTTSPLGTTTKTGCPRQDNTLPPDNSTHQVHDKGMRGITLQMALVTIPDTVTQISLPNIQSSSKIIQLPRSGTEEEADLGRVQLSNAWAIRE